MVYGWGGRRWRGMGQGRKRSLFSMVMGCGGWGLILFAQFFWVKTTSFVVGAFFIGYGVGRKGRILLE